MRSLPTIAALAIIVGGSATFAPAGADEQLRIAGTGGATGMMRRLGAAFTEATGIGVDMVPNLGSFGALRALQAGVLDMAVTARPLKSEEVAHGLVETQVARTALVFVTSHPNPPAVKSGDLAGLFRATNPTWADGSPLYIILRSRIDVDTLLIGQRFAGLREAIETARHRPDVPVAATDQDNAEFAERLAGSFVQAGLSQIQTERRNLRFVLIDGVAPSLANLESGAYPHDKPFYFVMPAKKSAAAERFLAFVRSVPGRSILRDTGNLPVAE